MSSGAGGGEELRPGCSGVVGSEVDLEVASSVGNWNDEFSCKGLGELPAEVLFLAHVAVVRVVEGASGRVLVVLV